MNLIIGIAGMVFILVAFILDEFCKHWNQDSIRYNVLNIIGSALLLWYAYSLKGWPFFILNAVWFVVALVKLVKVEEKDLEKKKRRKR